MRIPLVSIHEKWRALEMANTTSKTSTLVLALAGTLFLAGCGGENTNNISRSDRNDLQQACEENTNTGEEICTCVADLARDELSPSVFHMVLASVRGNTERAQEMSSQMTLEENTEAAAFMFGAFAQCAQAGASSDNAQK